MIRTLLKISINQVINFDKHIDKRLRAFYGLENENLKNWTCKHSHYQQSAVRAIRIAKKLSDYEE